MTSIEELAAGQQSQANMLSALAAELADLRIQQEQRALYARLEPSTPLRVGSYPAGAAIAAAGTTDPGSTSVLAQGAVTADSIAVGTLPSVQNLVPGGGFRGVNVYDWTTGSRIIGDGWWFYANGDTSAFATRWPDNETDWTLRDGDVDNYSAAAGPWGSTVAIYSTATTTQEPYISSPDIPVSAGETYSVSALMGCHRLTGALLKVWWYDAARTFLSESNASVPASGLSKQGGPWRDGWNYVTIEGMVAPATAQFARIAIVLRTPKTSSTECFLFADEVMFVKGPKAVAYAPYETSGVTNTTGDVVIDSSGITITNGALTVTSARGTVIADGNVVTVGANECPNPGFEIDTGVSLDVYGLGGVAPPGWKLVNLPNEHILSTSSGQRNGKFCIVQHKTNAFDSPYMETIALPVIEGGRYTAKGFLRGYSSNGAAAQGNFYVRLLDANYNSTGFASLTGTYYQTVGANTAWQQLSTTFVMPAGTVYACLGIQMAGAAGAAGDFIGWDDIEFYRSDQDVNHAGGNVVIDNNGVTITNGAIVVKNAGATVIIDGTSNMFKIAATGTHSCTGTATASNTVTLTALGTLSQCPVVILMGSSNNASTASQTPHTHLNGIGTLYGAPTSGGTPNAAFLTHTTMSYGYAMLNGSSNVAVTVTITATSGTVTRYQRYYVLKEASF